ncbi:uncharacterized protein LOC107371002 [Tetranychus urticae]|uniref:Uncharacterized protein n=1 Tax=Tetranychus urticae TaxID=32264 RepID=T1JVJ2_TETUR|nr:uncharacterized protein LOC107371002 [Tetranychus urticae]
MLVKMEKLNNNSDRTKFQVRFLGEYHEIVIDWNDEKYKYKQQQVIEQLASITGISINYTTGIIKRTPLDRGNFFFNNLIPRTSPSGVFLMFPERTFNHSCIRDGERYHLETELNYMHIEHLGIYYILRAMEDLEESSEGRCELVCRSKNTKAFINRIKDLVHNDELNAQISHRMRSLSYNQQYELYREFNILQYLNWCCKLHPFFSFVVVQPYLRSRG